MRRDANHVVAMLTANSDPASAAQRRLLVTSNRATELAMVVAGLDAARDFDFASKTPETTLVLLFLTYNRLKVARTDAMTRTQTVGAHGAWVSVE